MVVSGRGEAQVDRVEVDYPMLELELSAVWRRLDVSFWIQGNPR
jgi:hypothetical protein